MKIRQTKVKPKIITITAERLSDHSRITFSMSSDKTIEYLRSLLNHHLPPHTPNQFNLYSFQRGALIHFHPSSFKLDYFPVIFDQSVLLLQMDDRNVNNMNTHSNYKTKQHKRSLLSQFLSSKTTRSSTNNQSSSNITCLSIMKQIFRQRSRSNSINTDYRTNILTY
ncbi:unnamed protein product [Adineta steineri]|uniref:Uncharacterized protein n=1 Tax=Adineta steineri TaxID=433720 RepID=A0A814H9H4_9BILA|nr:unnamed protein product [Adineta steineri]CAF1006766.1 unnamed protein product [Adineta steineri]CAF1040898.1 unnamed protein product [Adineta steineri]CAF1052377.1 unnamed protein product [Adineta steineri]CAF1332123.1 unnamed protein product [Adineta steineri]